MNTPKHTPGPWAVTGEMDRIHGGEVILPNNGSNTSPIAVVCDFNRYDRDAERQANAQLIAAAPEMLELLAQLTAYLYATNNPAALPQDWHNARALLMKLGRMA